DGHARPPRGARLPAATSRGQACTPLSSVALGRGWEEGEIEVILKAADQPYERPAALAGTVAIALAGGAVVGGFQGRSEYGPRALGHRSLLCDPRRPENLGRMNAIKGREEFRPVAPMVLAA